MAQLVFVNHTELNVEDFKVDTLPLLNQQLRQHVAAINALGTGLADSLNRSNTRTARATTGNIPASTSISVKVPFFPALANQSYTVSISVNDPTGFLSVINWAYLAGGQGIAVGVSNSDSKAPHAGVVNVTAVQDASA